MSSEMQDPLLSLREYLASIPAGSVRDASDLEPLLAEAWPHLTGGDEHGMAADKLSGRTEDMEWSPPRLSFKIERHGGAHLGSSRAELQSWIVNVQELRASGAPCGHRRLRPTAPSLDVRALASAVAESILAGEREPRLRWQASDQVHVVMDECIPASGPKQTTASRRKRFHAALEEELASHGWVRRPGSSDYRCTRGGGDKA